MPLKAPLLHHKLFVLFSEIESTDHRVRCIRMQRQQRPAAGRDARAGDVGNSHEVGDQDNQLTLHRLLRDEVIQRSEVGLTILDPFVE